jgi:GTP-binding protein
MTTPPYQKATFLLSAAKLSQLPFDEGIEVAIVGRSNSGKSSVLNSLTQNKKLARVSKTPGRTQLINVFPLDGKRRLIDLPGYGFAKVPDAVKQNWEILLNAFLRTRTCLAGLVVVMDIRHPFRDSDQLILEWASSRNLPVHILLNKCDKLSNNLIKNTEREVLKVLAQFGDNITLQAYSAENAIGLREFKKILDAWYA